MNFLIKMVNAIHDKIIIWQVLNLKRFTGKIRITFYIGGQSSNFLKFNISILQICFLNKTQKFVWGFERTLQNMKQNWQNCVIISTQFTRCVTTVLLSTKLLEQRNKMPVVMISLVSLLKVTTYLR